MSDKIKLTAFEYDYLMAQVVVDTQILHMDAMIRKGYFSTLSDYFSSKDIKVSPWHPDGKLHYLKIGVIRDLCGRFEIDDGRIPSLDDFSPRLSIPTGSDLDIVKNCVDIISRMFGDFREYLDFRDVRETPDPFEKYISSLTIVRDLLLIGTTHSDGTTTRQKCRELGLSTDMIFHFST